MGKSDHDLRSAEQALLTAIEQIAIDHRLSEDEVLALLLKDAAERASMMEQTRRSFGMAR